MCWRLQHNHNNHNSLSGRHSLCCRSSSLLLRELFCSCVEICSSDNQVTFVDHRRHEGAENAGKLVTDYSALLRLLAIVSGCVGAAGMLGFLMSGLFNNEELTANSPYIAAIWCVDGLCPLFRVCARLELFHYEGLSAWIISTHITTVLVAIAGGHSLPNGACSCFTTQTPTVRERNSVPSRSPPHVARRLPRTSLLYCNTPTASP